MEIRRKILTTCVSFQRSLKVIVTDTDWSATYDFQLAFHSNLWTFHTGWEGNRRSGVAQATRHTDVSGSPPIRAQGGRPRRGRWAPAYALLVHGVWWTYFTFYPISSTASDTLTDLWRRQRAVSVGVTRSPAAGSPMISWTLHTGSLRNPTRTVYNTFIQSQTGIVYLFICRKKYNNHSNT